MCKAIDAPCKAPDQLFCDLNVDNHVHVDAEFIGQINIKHI